MSLPLLLSLFVTCRAENAHLFFFRRQSPFSGPLSAGPPAFFAKIVGKSKKRLSYFAYNCIIRINAGITSHAHYLTIPGNEGFFIMEPIQVGFLCLLPPLIAIALALITKEVISSLIIGIFTGTVIYTVHVGGGLAGAVSNMFTIMSDEFSASMIIFLSLLGALVAVVSMAGGSRAYGNWASGKVRSAQSAQLATSALGAIIFIDDYFNCLTVGTVMKPVTDKFRISRAKLAYIIDATAAPICIIAPVSSWAASVISSLPDTGSGGMHTFISAIPYNLYAILTIVMVILLSVTRLDYGPMEREQAKALAGGEADAQGSSTDSDLAGLDISPKGRVFDLLIPIIALILFSVLSMLYTGGYFSGQGLSLFDAFGATNANLSLAMGGFGALVVAALLFIPRRVLSFRDFMKGVTAGVKSMVSACVILTLAWTIKGVCSTLSVDSYVATAVKNSSLPVIFLPAIIFVVAAFLSFSTGTAWGTFGILLPIVVPICSSLAPEIMTISLSATLAGSVFGDHCSPISDTTILSSTGANCDHILHVSTQIPYACTVAVCCLVGYLVAGFTQNIYLTLGVSVVLLVAAILVMHRITDRRLAKKAA